MKHIKGYKIFESESSDFNDEIKDTLSNVSDYGYTVNIYDYYHTPNDNHGQNLFNNKASVSHLTNKIKLIKLSNKKLNSQYFNTGSELKIENDKGDQIFSENYMETIKTKSLEFFDKKGNKIEDPIKYTGRGK
jgi:hypothetical protein